LNVDLLLLAAGFGKRLGELTRDTPKPLVQVAGRAVIDYNLELISRSGIKKIFVNLHYRGEQLKAYLGDGKKWGLEIQFVEEPVILDTGGAIRNIESLLEHETLVTINSDVVIGNDFSLQNLVSLHQANANQPVATLALREDPDVEKYGMIGISTEGQVVSFLGEIFFPVPVSRSLMYLGIQAMSRSIFRYMPARGSVFSVTKDTYREVLRSGGYLGSMVFPGWWFDIGSPNRLEEASNFLKSQKKVQ